MSQTEQVLSQDLDVASTSGLRYARVNLLPPEIGEARRLKRTQVALAGGLAVVVVAMGAVYFTQLQDKHRAEEELAVSKAETVRLEAEQAKYADVPNTIKAIDAAVDARATAMASDIQWYRTLNNFSLVMPAHTWMTNMTLTVAPPAAAAGTAPTATPATGGVGTLSVQGVAMDHPDVATWLDVLGRQPGMSNAYFSTSAKSKIGETSVVNFSSTATITEAALSHRYDRKQG